jgi:hypothetical protein
LEQEYTLSQLQQGKSDCGKCGLSPQEKRDKTMKAKGFGVAVKQYPEYIPWANMHKRCYDINHPAYKNYGGRGIVVCERWNAKTNKRGVGFLNFIEDIGRRPSPDLTLERIKTDLNYEPGNCRWATDEEQNNNRRNTIYVEIDGITLSVGQWARQTGIPYSILWNRFKTGWNKQEAITTPVKRGNRKRC